MEPNPIVGAVVVANGLCVGVGHHERFGGPHAEVVALAEAGSRSRGATLYVTLEPCCHYGKTPPCTNAILEAGIARVVAAMRDPFPHVAGNGIARLREATVAVDVGVAEDSARRANAPYLKRVTTGRPFVIAKWAMTLDGKTAVGSGDSRWISNPRSRALVHELRGRMDGIVVGVETAIADDPQLTARPAGPRQAVRIVLDSAARLPLDGQLVRTARDVPVWVAVSGRAPEERHTALAAHGCKVLRFPGVSRVPVLPLLDELGQSGLTNLLIEGGGTVMGSFLDVGEVDAVDVFLAPILEGGDHRFTPVRGKGTALMSEALRLDQTVVNQVDGDVRVQGLVARPWLKPEPA